MTSRQTWRLIALAYLAAFWCGIGLLLWRVM